MRNLKRVLALALAVVMMIGMMVTASAASYADAADITANYKAAVNVTSDMGIFKGQTTGFAPKATLTRAEAAAIIYRVMTTDVTDSKVSIYDYASLKDIEAGKWYTGYVTYANNGGYVKGDGTNFYPLQTVTGVQFLAMVLRAMGYGQNGEFEGAGWKDMVLTRATDLGLVKNIVNVASLDAPASRELVAQLLFDALQATTTYYTPALGYIPTGTTLGAKFGLAKADYADKWGRPGVEYSFTTGTKTSVVMYSPKATYTTAVTECQIAQDAKLTKATEFTVYTNGKVNATKYTVQPTDLVQRIGATGTVVEVYRDDIVVIDTFLAKVTNVTPVTYDPANHKIADATIKLDVYTYGTLYETVTKTSETNFPYAKGDYVLVSAYTNNTLNATTGAVTVVYDQTNPTLKTTTTNNVVYANYLEIQGKANTLVGAQTLIWYNAEQHTVNGTTYNDSKWFELDQATTETSNHTWYFDSYGNLIGATDIATVYAYGVLENIQWINPVGTAGYAQATIRYMDGTTETKTVTAIDGTTLKYAQADEISGWGNGISTDIKNNIGLCGNHLYRIETATNGSIKLVHVFHTDVVSGTATSYNSQLTAATIKGNGVNIALAAITGTAATGDSHDVLYTNSNTTFLVKGTAGNQVTYTVVKGYENMATYTGATVDYVDLNGDKYADLVYVTGTPDSAKSWNLFMPTTSNVKAVLKADGTVDYYEVTGILNDAAATVKVTAAADMSTLIGNVNKMFGVYVDGGKVTDVLGDAALTDTLISGIDGYPGYKSLSLDYQAAGATITSDGQVMNVNGTYYNIIGLTPVVGQFAANMSSKNVYVIYDNTNTIGGAYVAKAVYILDVASNGQDSGSGVVTDGTIVRTLNIVNKDTGAVLASYTDNVTVTGGTQIVYTTGGMAGIFGVSTTGLNAWGAATVTVQPAAGQTVNATLNAYYAN